MTTTRTPSRTTATTNKARYGDDYYAVIGAMGGAMGHTGGFHQNKELARIAGRLGGFVSRRGKSKLTVAQRIERGKRAVRARREFERNYVNLMKVRNQAIAVA
jgi:hypothetical protein